MLEPQTLDESALVAKTEYSEQGKNDFPKKLRQRQSVEGEQGQSLVHLLQKTKAHKKEVLEAEW